ncbi:MAG: type II secretion system F family protein [Candidatus Gracilibacteria bacterium]|nr:type II secretion system F family protein [Candidatus Gracilibacteria bacterium]
MIDVKKIQEKSAMEKLNEMLISMQTIKTKEKVIFYRLLSTMVNAGMSLLRSMMVLEKQEKNLVFKKILGRFCEELKSGKSLSECLGLYPSSFSNAEVGIVRSGEKTGKLNTVLLDLANQVEKVASISGKLKSAMIYPLFILVVVFGVVFVMMTMVVPKLLDIFEDKASLPASTQTLIALSNFFTHYWYLIIILVFGIIVGISLWKKTASGRYLFDSIILKVPVFGEVVRKIILSKFSRIFAGLIGSGVSIVESLRITSDAVGNEAYRQRLLLLSEDVKGGIKIWESIDSDEFFPEMVTQMIQVGEETAKLDQVIVKVADFYDEQVDNTITNLNKLLEPFIIVFLAVVVGFIAMAIMQPIMNLADTVSNS